MRSKFPGPAWTYWDEKACAEDMEEMWRDPEVRIEWEKAGERRGKVRFSRNSQMQPYLTQTELKVKLKCILPNANISSEGCVQFRICF